MTPYSKLMLYPLLGLLFSALSIAARAEAETPMFSDGELARMLNFEEVSNIEQMQDGILLLDVQLDPAHLKIFVLNQPRHITLAAQFDRGEIDATDCNEWNTESFAMAYVLRNDQVRIEHVLITPIADEIGGRLPPAYISRIAAAFINQANAFARFQNGKQQASIRSGISGGDDSLAVSADNSRDNSRLDSENDEPPKTVEQVFQVLQGLEGKSGLDSLMQGIADLHQVLGVTESDIEDTRLENNCLSACSSERAACDQVCGSSTASAHRCRDSCYNQSESCRARCR